MVKKITIVPVNPLPIEEATPEVENIITNEEVPPMVQPEINEVIPETEPRIIEIKDESLKVSTEESKPEKIKKVKKEMLSNMKTTEKVISQVQCQACGKSMSAKNLKYSHAAYCIKRVQELDKPKAIPVPKKIIPKLKKILPVKGVKQDVESDDDEPEIVKNCILPEHTDINPMNILKNKILKAQEEYMANNKHPQPPMYKTEEHRPEEIIPPTYEVRMKNARQKKQEKYDKLASKAF